MEALKFRSPLNIPGVILQRNDLRTLSKMVYAQIRYCQNGDPQVSIDLSWMASALNTTRKSVSSAVKQLKAKKLIKVFERKRRTSLYSVTKVQHKNFFLSLKLWHSGLTPSKIVLVNYLKFRQGSNDRAWPLTKTIAADLGLTRQTIKTLTDELEDDGYLDIRRANGGIKQGHKYALTNKAFTVTLSDTKPESRVKKRYTDSNTYLEVKENNVKNPPVGDLSEHKQARQMLLAQHVAWPVAHALSKQHSRESIKSAILNAIAQSQHKARQGEHFKIPGYIVATLNGAKTERKPVQLNLFAKQEYAKYERLKDVKGFDTVKAISQERSAHAISELEQRKQALAAGTAIRNVPDGIRKLLGVA